MAVIYRIIIFLYTLAIRLAAPFNERAGKWVKGRKHLFSHIKEKISRTHGRKTVWFHCASLGEFEQGRPVMEAIRQKSPDVFIVLTFFSPSGYEIRKNYDQADLVTYLPVDTPKNARWFLDEIRPDIAVFVKYEFWYFFLRELRKRDIPTLLISAIFRKEQLFFKNYGKFYLNMLRFFTRIFVQDPDSRKILNDAGIPNVEVSGDTRYDRVLMIAENPAHIPQAESFARGHTVIVAGSTWPEDEKLLVQYILGNHRPYRWIIAPHEINESHIASLMKALSGKAERFSQLKGTPDSRVHVLVIDNVGILSSLYALGDVAYIGGGFGKGIHNLLEAAVYGVPVIFGPNYHKFREAHDLIRINSGFSISSFEELSPILNQFYDQPEQRKSAGKSGRELIRKKAGATQQIVNNMLTII